jgi:hypothetical protein
MPLVVEEPIKILHLGRIFTAWKACGREEDDRLAVTGDGAHALGSGVDAAR